MTAFRFVHAADLHLDSPFVGLHGVAPEHVAARLRESTFEAWRRIVDLCITEKVDALLVAGDVFDGADRSLRAQLQFRDGIERLHEAGIRSFVCHGNHDHLGGWGARLRFPDSCYRFGADVEAVPLDPARPAMATVYGVSYPVQNVTENLTLKWLPRGEGFSIGLLHANVGSNPEHASYAPCTVDDLRRTGMDYWALGHVHTRQTLSEARPTVVYPGNPQGRHPNETGERGVYLVDVDERGGVSLDFREMGVVRWEQLVVDATGMNEEQELLDAADEAVARAVRETGDADLVYRLRVVGRGPLRAWLAKEQERDQFVEQLNDRFAVRAPFAWCERLTSEMRSEIDRAQFAGQEDFTGELLRLVDRVPDDAAIRSRLTEALEGLYGSSRVRGYLDQLSDAEVAGLVEDAEARCLEALVED